MTMQGGTARDRLRARAQAMYGGKRREDEEQQNRQNQRQEVESPAVGSARDRLRQRASAMGEVTGQGANAQEPTQERSRLTVEGYEAAIKGMQERMGGQTGLTKSGIVQHTQSRETEKWRQEQAKKYSGLRDQADYAKKSTKVDQSLASGKGAYIFGHYVGKGDDVYSYINSIGTAYENRSNAGETPSGKLAKYAYMTDDEVADYNYLYQTKGKEEAEKYLEYMGTELDARRAAGFSQWNSELAEKAPVLASAASVPMNLTSGVGLVGVGLQNIRNQVTGEYKPINYYSPAMDATVASTAIRGTRAQHLADKYGTIQMDEKEHPLLSRIFNGKSWGDVYQLGMSMVDSAAAAGIGQGTGLTAAGTALLGGSAGSQGVLDAVERGATDSQALTMGILNATFESLFEYVSLDHLLKGNTKNILKGFLKQGFIEGSEEWNTTLFNTIADVLVMAENSDYKTSVRDYMEQGYSEKEAERQAMFDIAVGMGWDFVGGAISGGLMDTGKQIVRDAKYKSKFGKASGDIVAEAQEVAPGTALTQKAQERIDAGKSLTGHQIVNLLQQNEDAIRTGDMVTIRNAVAERLAQYGESQNIDRVADAITKQVAGEKLSGKEKALVENSTYGQRVLNEMNPENISEGGFNSDWAGQLGTTQINAEAYSQKLREAQAETQQEEPQQNERQEMTPEEMAVLSAWNSEAESSPANSTTVQPTLGDSETLKALGVKTGSQLRAEVRQALMERQAVAQEAQQRTQVAQQTQQTQETAQQTQGEPVTLEEASKAYGKQAKAFLRTYQQGQDVEKFSEAYRIAHEMGQSNVPYRVVQGMRSLDYLTEAQKDIAYRTGASAEQQEGGGRKATWRKQGVVRAENGAKLSDLSKTFNVPQKQGYRILSDIAKATGVDIVLYRSKGDAEGNITEAEGRFRRSENTIYIDVNSGIANVNSTADFSQYTMLRTFNHEFTHFIEQNADEDYRELRKLVFEAMQEKLDSQEGGVTVDDLIREKQDKYRQALGQEISYEKASREVVADAMTDILPDSHFMETLYNRNATLAEKLIGKLKDFIAKVKAYFDGLTTNTKAEAALLKEMRDGGLHYLERIVEAYDKAATVAVENYQGVETRSEGKAQKEQLAIREAFSDEIDQWDKDGKPEGVRFTLGSTGPVLQGLGAIESDIYMEGDKISTILREHPEMTLAEIKKIPQILEDPALVLKSKTRGGTSNTRLVLLDTAKAKNGRNIVAVLDLRPVEKGFAIDDMQKVSSAYTKTATENRTAKENSRGFLKTSDVLFLDKKRATSLLKTMGFSMPIELHRNGYIGSISYFKQNVNIKGVPFSSVVGEGDVQFSIREIAGTVMPVLDTQKDTRNYSVAEAYLKTLVDTEHPFSTILMDAQPVYIGRDLPGEYRSSEYTKTLRKAIRDVKMQAATNLDEMLLLAENGEWHENIKEKHKVDAKNGWYRYSTQFAVPVLDIKKSVDHYTVYSGTLLIRNDADGKSYLYDLLDIKKEKVISSASFSARGHSEVFEPKPSQTQYTQNQTESQAQIRSSTLSDRDVLRIAAQMAKNSESRSLTDADRARLGIIEQKLGRIDEAEEQRQGFLEEKRAILAGREAKELSDAERAQLRKVQKNLDTVNGKIRRLNEELSQTQEKKVVKALLKKARVVVERDAVQRSVSSYRETRHRAEYMGKLRRSVERNAKRLQEMLLTNTDKKHVPEALKKPVAELLRSMNLISKRGLAGGAMTKADERYVKALRGIQDVLARQSLYEESGKGDDLIGGYLDLPAGFQMLLNAYVSKVEKAIEEHPLRNGVLQTMTVEELEETNTVLSVISTAVTEMNKLMVNRQFATVVDAAEDTIWALNEHEQHQKKTGENFLVWDNCLPWYAFQRFGEGGKSIFQGLMNGWDKLAFNTKKVLDFRNGLIDDKTARKWDTETHTVMLENSKGGQEEVTLTTAQLMSLYCLSRRKQAMGHLMGGGIRIASIDIAEEIENVRAAEEGKPVREKKKKKKDVDQAEHYLLTQGELGRLLSLLTPEQVQAAKAMQRYMTEQGSAWGNEVSMRRFGYRAFTEENYFPIETDSQDRPAKTDSKEGSLYRLLNISAVKPLTEGANNAIMVRSIFDVFANHMADMAKYNALALPVLDAQKWYNYKDSSKNKDNGQVRTRTVQREMTRAWGSGANNYVVTFLKDINGVKENGARGEGMAAKAISKYKRAAVAANLRVAMLQPTSYVRASAVIDHKYLAKAMTKKVITKAEGQEMLQYSGVALWKEMGFFDTDVGRSIRDRIKGKGSKIEDLVDKSMAAAQAGDKITWERLWLACKLEAEEKRHLTGEELMEATAERFREVIYRTQVVDSTMTRSHMMRDGGTFSKIATSFMSEATVSYNMLMNSTLDTLQDAQSMGMQKAVKKNWRQLGRAYQAYILAGAASAIAGALADALRDWDDDSFLEKFWKAFWGEKPEKVKDQVLNIMLGLEGNLAGELNPLSKIPLIRDVTNTFGGFSTDRMDMAAWANLYSLLGIWEETIELSTGSLDKATKTTYYGNMTTYNKIYKTAQVVSQFTGLPISATMREIVTMWNSTVGLAYPGTKVRTYESRKVREAYEQYGKSVGLSYVMILRAAEAVRQLESDKDEDGNAISGSLKKKYVEYIQSLHLSAKQEKAMWNCIKKTSWSDKDTPWGK